MRLFFLLLGAWLMSCARYEVSMPDQWRLNVLNALGVQRFVLDGNSPVSALRSFQVAADGNCLDAVFVAKNKDLGINALDIVVLESKAPNATVWKPRYAGEVILEGSKKSFQSEESNLTGLFNRLKNVAPVADFYTGGDAGAVARAMVNDLVSSGRIGAALVYDASLIPDAGVTIGDIRANSSSVGELLELIRQQVPNAALGVNAERKVFLRVPSGSVSLTDGVGGTSIKFQPIAADQVINTIDWLLQGEQPSGVLTYRSQNAASAALYGERRIALIPDSSLVKIDRVPTDDLTITASHAPRSGRGIGFDNSDMSFETTPTQFRALDGDSGSFFGSERSFTVTPPATVTVDITVQTPANCVWMYAEVFSMRALGNIPQVDTLQLLTGAATYTVATQSNKPDGFRRMAFSASLDSTDTTHVIRHKWDLNYTGASYSAQVWVFLIDVRVHRAQGELLDQIAESFYRDPAADPATITTDGMVEPVPTVTMTSSHGTSTRPAKVFTYVFTKELLGKTIIDIDQSYDPIAAANAALVSAKDNLAAVSAAKYASTIKGGN